MEHLRGQEKTNKLINVPLESRIKKNAGVEKKMQGPYILLEKFKNIKDGDNVEDIENVKDVVLNENSLMVVEEPMKNKNYMQHTSYGPNNAVQLMAFPDDYENIAL
ncbi:6985_t:CDS:2 [Entrophospora sp. SA101]|nr:6985_t:CDS:2 [Entrophospora sp. SA101]